MLEVSVSPLTKELLGFASHGMPHGMAMLSILDHARDCEPPMPVPRVLRLHFDDAPESDWWQALITPEQALAIRDFVLSLDADVELLIIHCTEGVSRSTAVAAAVLDALGGDSAWIWNAPYYRPNPLVYRRVVDAFLALRTPHKKG